MGKYKYLLIVVLLVLFNICVVVKNQNHYYVGQYAISTNNQENKLEIADDQKYKIKAYYPDTGFTILDYKIGNKIGEYIDTFKTQSSEINNIDNQYYTLNILYDSYSCQDYLSYVFYIEYYIGGAHPNNDIWTIVYDKSSNKVVTLDDLILTNSEFLKIVSEYSRNELLKNSLVDTSMLLDGTKPKEDNFSRFVFSKEGILLFFPQYQVAPYSSGSFVVNVPYDLIFRDFGLIVQ